LRKNSTSKINNNPEKNQTKIWCYLMRGLD
jgi:hypothetical protein